MVRARTQEVAEVWEGALWGIASLPAVPAASSLHHHQHIVRRPPSQPSTASRKSCSAKKCHMMLSAPMRVRSRRIPRRALRHLRDLGPGPTATGNVLLARTRSPPERRHGYFLLAFISWITPHYGFYSHVHVCLSFLLLGVFPSVSQYLAASVPCMPPFLHVKPSYFCLVHNSCIYSILLAYWRVVTPSMYPCGINAQPSLYPTLGPFPCLAH